MCIRDSIYAEPGQNIQTEAFGEQKNLTDKQVRAVVERNPELSPEDRQKVLDNTRKIILASNRRAHITPSNAAQAVARLCAGIPPSTLRIR